MPATVQAVLAARIDRLPPEEKRLLQTAAVIGTDVPLPLLQAIAELPEAALHRGLAHLQAAEFLYETRLFPELEYTFKHALTHEVAYGSLLQERRRALHARIVEAIEALAPTGWPSRSNGWPTMPCGARCGTRPGVLPAGGGEGHGAVGLPRGRGVLRAGARRLCASAGDARHARAGHRSPARPALGALAVWRLWAHPGVSARGRGPRRGPRRPASAGTGLAFSVTTISTHGARMTRPSPPPSAPSRSPRPAGMSSCMQLANHHLYLGQPTMPRATIVGRSTASGRPWRPSTGRGATSASARSFLPAVISRAYLPGAMPSWARSPRAGPRGRRAPDCRGGGSPREPDACASGDRSVLRQGDLPRALPLLERAVGICQDADLPSISPGSLRPWGRRIPWPGASPTPCRCSRRRWSRAIRRGGRTSRRSVVSPWARRSCWLAAAWRRRTPSPSALALARAHQERGHQAYALRLLGDIPARREPPEAEQAEAHYQQALALAEELGMRPLQAHCHLGLGTLYAKIGQRSRPAPSCPPPSSCTAPWT